jgi:hypothetical protein
MIRYATATAACCLLPAACCLLPAACCLLLRRRRRRRTAAVYCGCSCAAYSCGTSNASIAPWPTSADLARRNATPSTKDYNAAYDKCNFTCGAKLEACSLHSRGDACQKAMQASHSFTASSFYSSATLFTY